MTRGTDNLGFSKALKRLDEIVEKLEDPDLDLEEGLKLLEEGVKLHKYCKERLTEADVKIKAILGKEPKDFDTESEVI